MRSAIVRSSWSPAFALPAVGPQPAPGPRHHTDRSDLRSPPLETTPARATRAEPPSVEPPKPPASHSRGTDRSAVQAGSPPISPTGACGKVKQQSPVLPPGPAASPSVYHAPGVARLVPRPSRTAAAVAGLAVATLVLAACGDDSTGDRAAATATTGDLAPNTAVVTVGTMRYQFEMTGLCLELFGVLRGTGYAPDDHRVVLNIDLPPRDWAAQGDRWEPPVIRVNDGVGGFDWHAGGPAADYLTAMGEITSAVNSYTSDGASAAGQATFFDLNAALAGATPRSVAGTFRLRCAW